MNEFSTKKAQEILQLLKAQNPNAKCELNFKTDFQLLVAVILSAQCTDKRVNKVTEKLFKVCNTPRAISEISQERLEQLIFECGFYHNKAKNLIAMSKQLMEKFDGKVPDDLDKLVTLAGVGRKTANVILAEAFGKQAIAVDTHVGRVSNRLGLSDSKNPLIIERDLMQVFSQDVWSLVHHLLIFQGRYTCKSQRPNCENCNLTKYCNYYKKIRRNYEQDS